MAVFRVERNRGYTVMSNHHLRNKELCLACMPLAGHGDEVGGRKALESMKRQGAGVPASCLFGF